MTAAGNGTAAHSRRKDSPSCLRMRLRSVLRLATRVEIIKSRRAAAGLDVRPQTILPSSVSKRRPRRASARTSDRPEKRIVRGSVMSHRKATAALGAPAGQHSPAGGRGRPSTEAVHPRPPPTLWLIGLFHGFNAAYPVSIPAHIVAATAGRRKKSSPQVLNMFLTSALLLRLSQCSL